MEFNQNRLRFVHCEHLFNDVQEIKDYVRSVQFERASLYAEPMIFKYGAEKEPCIVLAIGSVGEGEFIYDSETGEVLNETYYIDFSQVERDIVELYKQVGENRDEIKRIDGIIKNMIEACGFDEEGKYIKQEGDKILQTATSLQVADKMLSDYILALEKRHELYIKDTNSLDLSIEKGDTGVTIHGDVKRGTKIYEGRVIENIIVEQEDGIFTSVDLDYSEVESKLTLTINGDQKKDIPLPVESHVIKGEYDPYTEMLILTLNNAVDIDGELKDKVEISIAKLIDEWEVLGEASDTPIVLTKEHVKSNDTEHDDMYEWQDILKADIRILDNQTMLDNILKKDSSGKFLYVDGTAVNISYLRNGEKINVQQGIDEKLSKTDISKYDDNTIVLKEDGLFSYIDFSYDNGSNKIIFKRTNPKGEILTQEYVLNSFSFIEGIEYDPMSEEIVITYKDANNDVHKLRIPLHLIVSQFEVENGDTTVTLTLIKNPQGIDKLKADVNISSESSNILEDVGHALLVRGTADNIKMIDKVLGNTVEEAIQKITTDNLNNFNKEKSEREESDRTLQANIDSEVLRAKEAENQLQLNVEAEERRAIDAEEKLDAKIEKEIETARENEKTNADSIEVEKLRATKEESRIEEKLDSEISRSSNKDNEIELALNEEIVRAKTSEHDIKVDVINEVERATLAEKDINDRLVSEIERSKTIDSEISTALSDESNRAKKAESDLNLALTNEIDRAKLAEQSLKDSIASETNRAQGVEHTLEYKILAEQTRAENIENTIIRNLNDEVSRASRVEETLRNDLTNEINRATTAENTINEKVDAEIKRSSDADEALSERLIHTAQDLSFITRDSGTVTLIKTTENVGSSITAEVNISNKENNLLNKNGEPLYASVDIEYNSAENKLILKRSGNVDKEIKLNEGSIINSIVYDSETKQLIITYFDAYGNERVETVNVTDLFNQWIVETNHLGAVLLTKEVNYNGKGTDKLSAEVVVSELPSNMLVNDRGSLYVSNSGENIMLGNGEKLTDAIDSLRNKDIELNQAILDETARATEAEAELDRKIVKESETARLAEENLNNKISSEIERAKSEENRIETKFNEEVVSLKSKDSENTKAIEEESNRAKEAEKVLEKTITDETNRAINAEHLLEDSLLAETNRAKKAEESLTKDLSDEVSRATRVETEISDKLNIEIDRAKNVEETISNNLTREIERATNKENEIETSLQNEINRATNAEHLLEDSLLAETNRATIAEKAIDEKVNELSAKTSEKDLALEKMIIDEINRSKLEDSNLQVALNSEIERAKIAETSNENAINAEQLRAERAEHALSDSILAEERRATSVEEKLTNDLASEVSRATRVEGEISDKLNAEITRATSSEEKLTNDLASEVSRAKAKENELTESLQNEINRATNAEHLLEDSLLAETNRAKKAEDKLEKDLSDEVSRATRVETEISDKLNAEITRATSSEEKLTSDLASEVSRATRVEGEISDNLNSEVTRAKDAEYKLTTDLGVEISRAKSEEARIETKVDTLSNDTNNLHVSLENKVNEEISRSTQEDSELRIALDTEINRAKESENTLSNSIISEKTRAEASEATIQANLNNEIVRATSAEEVLASNINNNSVNLKTETEQRIAEDNYLRELIVSETLRANEADNALKDSITEETTRAVNAEADLASQIATEKGRAETAETALEKELASVKNSVSNNTTALDSLMSDVEEVVKTYAMSVEDTATVDLTKKSIDAGGFIVSADLKISSKENNQIIKYDDGIFSNVNLTYSNNNNTLHFSTNGNTVDIPLTSVSTIEKISYDAENNEIVISYISNGELKETRFSANSLFKPVVTNNNGNNVIVESNTNVDGASELSANLYFKDNIDNEATTVTLKATEDNKLKASVNVGGSASVRNILEITDDGNSLFVNGQATNIDMVNKQLGSGTENDPHVQVDNVETAIHSLDDRIDVLRRELEGYLGDDLINSIVKDINNLKFKTNIVAKDTPSVDLTFESSEMSSSMKADVVMSQDPHNLLTVFDDEWPHDGDGYGVFNDGTYNGVLFDGNIDYLTFQHKDILSGNTDHWSDWTRHLQLKRDDVIFENRSEALEFLNNAEFLNDKKDGEPLLARYKDVDGVRVILAFVRVENDIKTVQTIDSKGTTIDELTYCPDEITKIATDAYGIQTTTIVPAECLYLEYTDSASIKHTLVVPLKDLIEEYSYPDAIDTYDGQKGTSDGESVKTFHNVKFDVERHENGKSIIKADIEYFDCGWY